MFKCMLSLFLFSVEYCREELNVVLVCCASPITLTSCLVESWESKKCFQSETLFQMFFYPLHEVYPLEIFFSFSYSDNSKILDSHHLLWQYLWPSKQIESVILSRYTNSKKNSTLSRYQGIHTHLKLQVLHQGSLELYSIYKSIIPANITRGPSSPLNTTLWGIFPSDPNLVYLNFYWVKRLRKPALNISSISSIVKSPSQNEIFLCIVFYGIVCLNLCRWKDNNMNIIWSSKPGKNNNILSLFYFKMMFSQWKLCCAYGKPNTDRYGKLRREATTCS